MSSNASQSNIVIRINSYNSLTSSPASQWNGTWLTGGTATTNKPHILIEPFGTTSTAWNTNGTGLGVNADSGFTGNLLDLQLGGTSKCKINYAGQVSLDSSTGSIGSSAGVIMKINFTNGIQIGNQTGIGVSWSNNANPSTSIDAGIFRDDIGALGQRYSTTAQAYSVYGTYTSATNYERVKLCYNSSATAFQIGTEKGSGGGTARNLQFVTDGTAKWEIGSSTDVYGSNGSLLPIADNTIDLGNNGKRIRNLRVGTSMACPYFTTYSALGSFKFTDGSGADFGKFQLGGTTASFPAIKRTGSDIEIVKADGTVLDTAIILGSPAGTRYRITVSDIGVVTTTAI